MSASTVVLDGHIGHSTENGKTQNGVLWVHQLWS